MLDNFTTARVLVGEEIKCTVLQSTDDVLLVTYQLVRDTIKATFQGALLCTSSAW